VKTFGIYLSYPPNVDLRAEGLGRYLTEFLNEAKNRTDARFVIACPSWMRKSLRELLEKAGIPPKTFEIMGPTKRPVLLRLYGAYLSYIQRARLKRIRKVVAYLANLKMRTITGVERTLATTRSPFTLGLLILLALPVFAIDYVASLMRDAVVSSRVWRLTSEQLSKIASKMMVRPQSSIRTVRLYRFMEEAEGKLLCNHINARKEISAWYAPTAFWPHFNDIKAPRLTCVPDVVFSEFPVAFSSVNYERFLDTFRLIERTIEGGDRFVTYSNDIKYRTLVERYRIAPEAITVIPHGVNRLDDLISVSGFRDNEAATDLLCTNLFRVALYKAINTLNATNFDSGDVRFIFYASQFRPNKNVITLLRAYEYLLRRRYVGHKLVLTGNPNNLPEIATFIRDHNLQNDVLCLHGLSAQELAACYRIADLAVNPSLSEGGCPFTLTEALSVGTPVVMARISVTEEVVTDPDLQKMMLFDPYKWEDIALRIEWGLQNREALLARQLELYKKLSERSWSTVIDEYIEILDRISSLPAQTELDANRSPPRLKTL
jgi:glycosyltransferase involved in cell wall biosynthesis